MPDCCELKFTVHDLAPTSGGGFFVRHCVDEKVRYCPFCGKELAVNPAPKPVKPESKRR
jgi:hypothetical protein